jgi:hypothetical protein
MSLIRVRATVRVLRYRLSSLRSMASRRLSLGEFIGKKARLRGKSALVGKPSAAALSFRAREVLSDLERQRERHEAGGTRATGDQ